MASISLSSATRFYDYANTFLIVSLVLGVISTGVLVWMGKIKEDYSNKEIASTNERAANAELKAAESMLELEKLRKETEPRKLTQEKQNLIESEISQFKNYVVSFYVNPSTNENEWLIRHLAAPFSTAGWKVNMKTGDDRNARFIPDGILVMSTMHDKSLAAAKVVTKAINKAGLYAYTTPGIDMETGVINDDNPNSYRLVIIIGDKPVHKSNIPVDFDFKGGR